MLNFRKKKTKYNYVYASQSKNDNSRKAEDYLTGLVMSMIGGIIVVLANQLFFYDNKEFEYKSELQVELLKEQYEYLNRILRFTHSYEVVNSTFVYRQAKVVEYREKYSEKLIKTDTVFTAKQDTLNYIVPSFVSIDRVRKQFFDDINIIKENKDKVDHLVYNEFEKILNFIEEHPLPKINDEESIVNSDWNKEEVKKEWYEIISGLYSVTYKTLYY